MAANIKVLHVINSLDTGGAEVNLLRLVKGLTPMGIESRVWVLRRGGALTQQFRDAGVQVGEAGKADLVHGWLYAGCVAASVLSRSRPTVWGIRHGSADTLASMTTRLSMFLMRHLLRCQVAVSNSQYAQTYHQEIGIRAQRWRVIPNGIDADMFVADEHKRLAFRAQLGLAAEDVLLVQMARLHPHKGQQLLLEAVKPLLLKHLQLHVLFVGRGCLALETSRQIHTLDGSHHPDECYAGADWLVNPSLLESSPTVVLEAMSCATPVIATDVGGTAELLADAGLLVAPTVAKVRSAIEKALHMPPTQQADRVTRGLAVSDRFSLQRMLTSYQTLYQELLCHPESKLG